MGMGIDCRRGDGLAEEDKGGKVGTTIIEEIRIKK